MWRVNRRSRAVLCFCASRTCTENVDIAAEGVRWRRASVARYVRRISCPKERRQVSTGQVNSRPVAQSNFRPERISFSCHYGQRSTADREVSGSAFAACTLIPLHLPL